MPDESKKLNLPPLKVHKRNFINYLDGKVKELKKDHDEYTSQGGMYDGYKQQITLVEEIKKKYLATH